MLLLVVVLGIGVSIDLSLTWIRHRERTAGLAQTVPARTAYMELRAAQGKPPAHMEWVALDALPVPLVCAVVASENTLFFMSGAVDWSNQWRMARRVLRGDVSRGSSNLPQQLARNLYLGPERTVRRKLREYALAYQVSHMLSKERQLELYLNLVEWAEGVWGVAAASQHYFGRPPHELRPTELVLLANILPAPSRGLAFPLAPPRRGKLRLITNVLWQQEIFDDVTAAATTVRLARIGTHIDAGLKPRDAAAVAITEMGEEVPLAASPHDAALSWAQRCDPGRRTIF